MVAQCKTAAVAIWIGMLNPTTVSLYPVVVEADYSDRVIGFALFQLAPLLCALSKFPYPTWEIISEQDYRISKPLRTNINAASAMSFLAFRRARGPHKGDVMGVDNSLEFMYICRTPWVECETRK